MLKINISLDYNTLSCYPCIKEKKKLAANEGLSAETGMSSKAARAGCPLFLRDSRYCHMTVENAGIM